MKIFPITSSATCLLVALLNQQAVQAAGKDEGQIFGTVSLNWTF